MSLPFPPLLIVTDRKQARAPLPELLAAAFSAGCRWASLREKDLAPRDQVDLALSLLPIARRYGARLTLHGDPALALEAGLDGVHLAAGSDVRAARECFGSNGLVGLSIHGGDDLGSLETGMLDYVIAGPAYETPSKPGYGPFLGPAGIASLATRGALPIIAIGGVDVTNAADLMRAGAAGIAAMGGVMRAAHAESDIRQLIAAIS